jgi:hypothetical protein
VKREVDAVVDHCTDMQNLRRVVYEQHELALTGLASRAQRFIRRGQLYLTRYLYLICFNACK